MTTSLIAIPAVASTCAWNVATASSGNWSSSGSWTSCASGVPLAGDTVTFNVSGKSGNCTLDVDPPTLASFTMNGYTGILSGSTHTLAFTGAFSQTTGTLSALKEIDVGTNFTLSGGTFNAPNLLVVEGTFSRSAGTFTAGSGTTVLLSDTASHSHDVTGVTFGTLSLNDGLLGYWKLDEASGTTAKDYSGFENDMTQTSAKTALTGATTLFKNPNGITFAKSNPLHLGYSSDYFQTGTWTLSAWAKVTDVGGSTGGNTCGDGNSSNFGAEIINVNNDYVLRLCAVNSNSGTATYTRSSVYITGNTFSGCSSTASFAMDNTSWHHVAASYDGSTTMTVWLDNQKATCTLSATPAFHTPTEIAIGGHTNLTTYNIGGSIDDVRVYNRVLTDEQISQLYFGAQPIVSTYTNTLTTSSGGVDVNGDLFVSSGTFSTAKNITVAGSWLNHGGYYTGTGSVTIDGGSGGSIVSNGQRFSSLAISGTGSWALQDRLWVDGKLYITSGTLDDSANYVIHAGTLQKTNGAGAVFTQASSSTAALVLDSTSSQILTADSTIKNLHIEDPAESNLVGYWKFDEPSGTTARELTGNAYVSAATLGSGVSRVNSGTAGAVAPTAFDNAGAVTFDTTDHNDATFTCTYPVAIYGAMTISAWIKTASVTTMHQRIVYTPWLNMSVELTTNKVRADAYWSGSTSSWETSDAITPGTTWQHVAVTYDGSLYSNVPKIYVNGHLGTVGVASGSSQPASGATRAATDAGCVIGNLVVGTVYGSQRDFGGSIDDVRIYSTVLSQAQITALYGAGTAGAYAGTGGTSLYTLQSNTTISGSTTKDSGNTQTVYRAYDDAATAGTVEGYPVSSFNWSTFAFNATYVLYNNVNGGTTDKLYKRDTDGSALAEWPLPTSGDFVGAPKWIYSSGSYYVYVIDTGGNAYKLLDAGSSFTQSATYRDSGGNATATSPLAADTTNIYWTGNQGASASTPMLFRLPQAGFSSPGSVSATVSNGAVPSLTTLSGSSYIFYANGTKLYKVAVATMGSPTASTFSTSNGTYGRVTVQQGVVYWVDYAGTVWAADPTNLAAASWSYHDNGNHMGCAVNTSCSAKNLFVDGLGGKLYFGDRDGHVYAVDTGTHAVLNANYPYRPGSSADTFEAAPLYKSGVIVVGSTAGMVYVIDQKSNAAGAPALISSINVESVVSTISYDFDGGQYVVGTNSGRLFYISAVSDPTPTYN